MSDTHPYYPHPAPPARSPRRWPWTVALIITGLVGMTLGCLIGGLAVQREPAPTTQGTAERPATSEDTTGERSATPPTDPEVVLADAEGLWDDGLGWMYVTVTVTNASPAPATIEVYCDFESADRSEYLSEGYGVTALLDPQQSESVSVYAYDSHRPQFAFDCRAEVWE